MVERPSERDVFPAEIARYIDVAAYVLDARAPAACLWLDEKLAGRECFVLAKADLADEKATAHWIKHFADAGYSAFSLDSVKGDGLPGFMDYLRGVYAAKSAEREAQGIKKTTLRIVALGVPNVGKSTLLNAILGRRRMRVGNRPGITRGYQWVRVMEGVDLLDTPGIIRETAHFRRARPVWLALNLLRPDEMLLESAAEVVLSALDRRARGKFEKLYGMEMPWDDTRGGDDARVGESASRLGMLVSRMGEPGSKMGEPGSRTGEPASSRLPIGASSPHPPVNVEHIAVKVAAIKRLYLGRGVPDLARSYRLILRDFQIGKFGRITLERASEVAIASSVFGRGKPENAM